MSNWHVGDHGKSLLTEFTDDDGDPLDLTDATLIEIEIQAPRKPWVLLEMADLDLTPSSGLASYPIPDETFLWAAGVYYARGYFESPTLGSLHTDIASFVVYP